MRDFPGIARGRKGASRLALLASAGVLVGVFAATALPSRTPQATTRTVAAGEFKFQPARVTVTEGVVVINLVNRGTVRHDLRVAGKKTPRIGAGARTSLRFGNLREGTYRFICTVPGHAELGMRGTLVVRASAPTETTEG